MPIQKNNYTSRDRPVYRMTKFGMRQCETKNKFGKIILIQSKNKTSNKFIKK